MEEKKPLESRLTHTSKEPEAQVWAQIGTKSYDPPVQSNDKSTKLEDSPAKKPPSQENGTSEGTSQVKESTENQEASYFIDTGTSESEKPEEKMEEKMEEETEAKTEAKKPKELPKSKSFTLGDGFVEPTTESEDAPKVKEEKETKDASRSRSRSRERKRSPTSKDKFNDYTTNSSNPDDIKARVFVGHLNTDKCSKKEVDELFSPFGRILGVNLQDGYGFVQYEDEKSVKEAIKHIHATMFHGDRLVVDRPVAMKKLEGTRRHERGSSGSGSGGGSKDLMDELEYYRRRDRDRRRYDEMYDRPGSRRDWDRSRPPMPPLLPPQAPSYYGDYMDRGDRYGVGDMGYGRYGDESRFRGDDRYRDESYRGDDRYSRSDPGRDPYGYSFSQRGNPYGDQYSKQLPRRM